MSKRIILQAALLVLFYGNIKAQYTTDKVAGEKNQALADSLKKADYNYVFPIWGKKVTNKGFNIPKSGGLSVQYIYQQSDIVISNLKVGFNNGPMHSLEEIVRIDNAVATTNGVNLRPDVWLFPFLNIYGILAKSESSTAIDAGIWLPDDSTWKEVGRFSTKADFDATTVGFGFTPTVGMRGFFLALDFNFSWSDIDALEEPAYVFVFGPRLGKNITFKNPNRSLALWAGGFRVKLNSSTSGSLSGTEIFPISEWEQRINGGQAKLTENQQKVDTWWNGLTPAEQKNPVNIAKHETANRVLTGYGQLLNSASQVVTRAGESSIQYSLEKKPKNMWNFIVGSQFQLNRSLMFRAEYGFLASREQFILGVQYRFNF